MKYIQYLWMCCIGLCLFACAETDELQTTEGKTGFVISLKEETVGVEARTAPKDLPYPIKTDFTIRILDAKTDEEVKSESCTGDNQLIEVGVGIYDVVAEYGDASAVALDAPYYRGIAEEQWVYADKATSVDLTCKVANSLVSIKYDETKVNFADVYEAGYYVKVVADGTPVEIKDITQSVYFPANTSFEVYFCAVKKGESEEREIKLDVERSTLNPADHLTLTLSPEPDKYEVPLSITKEEVKQEFISETIPMEWLPKPKVEAEGFEGNTLSFAETEAKNVKLNLKLSSALQDIKFKFNFEDAQEQFASLDKEKDYLLSNAEDKAVIETVLGTTLPSINATEASIDLSALVSKLQTNAGATTNNVITIDVQANDRWSSEDKSANLTYTLACNKPEFSVSVKPENCWAWEFTVDEVSVTKGDAEKIKSNLVYQYYDGTNWVDCSDGMTQKFAVDESRKNIYLEDEPEERSYQVRALYRGAIASAEGTATLEEPWQLPNSNMDEWQYEIYKEWESGLFNKTKHTYYSFMPWSKDENKIWDTNNAYTTRHRYNSSTTTYDKNGLHAVSYVVGRNNSGLAAELRNTANGRGNNDITGVQSYNIVPGELFTGTAKLSMGDYGSIFNDANGSNDKFEPTKDAVFKSRPTALSFWYKYKPLDGSSDAWSVYIQLLDTNGNTIVEKEEISSDSQLDWKFMTVLLPYEDDKVYSKCNSIFIDFKSSSKNGSDVPYSEQTLTFYIQESNGSLTAKTHSPAYIGSVLTIDDISLVYDK